MTDRISKGKILSAVLALYSIIGALLFVVFKKLIPFPLAEIVSFVYSYYKKDVLWLVLLFGFLYIATVAVTVLLTFRPYTFKPYLFIPVAIVFFIDNLIHLYAFLFASGYEWNYFISALLDMAIVFIGLKKEEIKNDVIFALEESE